MWHRGVKSRRELSYISFIRLVESETGLSPFLGSFYLLSFRFLSKNLRIKVYKNKVYLLFCMGVKTSLLH
jgi:hypothetical protein